MRRSNPFASCPWVWIILCNIRSAAIRFHSFLPSPSLPNWRRLAKELTIPNIVFRASVAHQDQSFPAHPLKMLPPLFNYIPASTLTTLQWFLDQSSHPLSLSHWSVKVITSFDLINGPCLPHPYLLYISKIRVYFRSGVKWVEEA